MIVVMLDLKIFERLPRPDEIIENERSFRNATILLQGKKKNASGCQSFIECPERLPIQYPKS